MVVVVAVVVVAALAAACDHNEFGAVVLGSTGRKVKHRNHPSRTKRPQKITLGAIAIRSGNPADTDPWGWICGFYPGSHPGEHQSGTAATFDQARAAFEAAWRVFLANRTEADFQEWRDQRDRTDRKYAL
jgi:hypothetical protein